MANKNSVAREEMEDMVKAAFSEAALIISSFFQKAESVCLNCPMETVKFTTKLT